MDPNSTPTTVPPTSQPTPKKFFPILPVVIVLLIAVAVAVAAAAYLLFFSKNTKPTPPTPAPEVKTMTGLEIAKKAAMFLDQNVKEDGTGIHTYVCRKGNCTVDNSPLSTLGDDFEIPPSLGHIALAYWELYKRTMDDSYKEKAERFMNIALDQCQKDERVCWGSNLSLNAFYQGTQDERYKDALLRIESLIADDKPLEEIVQTDARAVVILYQITGDPKQLERLQKYGERLLSGELESLEESANPILYKEGDFTVRIKSFIAAATFYPQAYVATNDTRYLTAMETYINKMKINDHIADFKNDRTASNGLALSALLALSEIAPLPQRQEYFDQAKFLAQETINASWDTPENKIYTGDYGFLANFVGIGEPNYKRTIQIALRILQFLKLEDHVFLIQ